VKHLIHKLGASPEHPILLIDADLESAGLTYYFKCNNMFTFDLNSNNMMQIFENIFTPGDVDFILHRGEPKRLVKFCDAEGFDIAKELDKYGYGTTRLSDVLGKVNITKKNAKILKSILNETLIKEKARGKEEYHMKYRGTKGDVWSLKDKLERIDREEDESSRDELKTKAIAEFLPCSRLLDVTDFFTTINKNGKPDLKPETILFLGTNTSKDERVAGEEATTNINKLLDLCDKYNFAATIFDSGSGTQSSAVALHYTSDIIVYCLRASLQFVEATEINIENFEKILKDHRRDIDKKEDKKSIILFPTAVPEMTDEGLTLGKYSFDKIQSFAKSHNELIDGTFCDHSTCLPEIQLFKWREKILGCKEMHSSPGTELYKVMDRYSHEELPKDVQNGASVYKKLADRIKENT